MMKTWKAGDRAHARIRKAFVPAIVLSVQDDQVKVKIAVSNLLSGGYVAGIYPKPVAMSRLLEREKTISGFDEA